MATTSHGPPSCRVQDAARWQAGMVQVPAQQLASKVRIRVVAQGTVEAGRERTDGAPRRAWCGCSCEGATFLDQRVQVRTRLVPHTTRSWSRGVCAHEGGHFQLNHNALTLGNERDERALRHVRGANASDKRRGDIDRRARRRSGSTRAVVVANGNCNPTRQPRSSAAASAPPQTPSGPADPLQATSSSPGSNGDGGGAGDERQRFQRNASNTRTNVRAACGSETTTSTAGLGPQQVWSEPGRKQPRTVCSRTCATRSPGKSSAFRFCAHISCRNGNSRSAAAKEGRAGLGSHKT